MSSSRALCCLPSVKKQKLDFQVYFVDRGRHQKIDKTRSGKDKVAKELFADYMKEKKLREPEEKKDVGTNFENTLCRSEIERIRSMCNKTIIRFGFMISGIIKVSVRVINLS